MWAVQAFYRVGGLHFGVRATSERFGSWLDYAFGSYRVAEPAAFRYSMVTPEDAHEPASTRPFYIMYLGSAAMVRTLNPVTLAAAFAGELEGLLVQDRDDAIHLTATALESGGRVGLVPGNLLLRLGRHGSIARRAGVGLPVTANVTVDASSGLLVPGGSLPGVPGDAAARLAEFPGFASGDSKDSFTIESPTAVDVVFVQAADDGSAAQPPSRASALYQLASMVRNRRVMGERALRGLAELVEPAVCRRVPRNCAPRDAFAGLARALSARRQAG